MLLLSQAHLVPEYLVVCVEPVVVVTGHTRPIDYPQTTSGGQLILPSGGRPKLGDTLEP